MENIPYEKEKAVLIVPQKTLFIIVLCLIISVFNINTIWANVSQSKKITLVVQNVTVKDAIEIVKKQSGYSFLIDTKDVDINKRVSVNLIDKPVSEILDLILEGQQVKYELKDGHIIISSAIIYPVRSEKNRSISGIVNDASGLPIVGATIVIKGTAIGTATNIDGAFFMNVPENAVLTVSYIGYLSQEVSVGNKNYFTISLKEHSQALDEVVVVGYGSVKKGNLTNAVTVVKSDVLENRPILTVTDALQGGVPGLSIVQSGHPGSASSMQLRGATSLNASGSPLLLVDGVPSEFNYLNMDDIESISVLKDAASAAIYGSRAAHGVILVTTKRGKKGKPTFRYNGYIGINTPTNMPEMVNSAEYARMRNESQRNIGRADIYSEDDIRKYASGEDPDRYPNTNWLDLMFQNSITTRHSIAATGGSESVKYYLSGGLDHQTGVIPEVKHDVFNVRSNVDVQVTKKFSISFDIRYILRKKDEVAGMDGIIIDAYKMNPTWLAYYSDGSYAYNANSIINPIAYLHEREHELWDKHDASGIFKISYKLLDGLKFTGLANVNYTFTQNSAFNRELLFKDYFSGKEVTSGQNEMTEKRESSAYYNLQALLSYQKKIGEHSLDILAGYQQENSKSSWLSGYRNGYPTDLVHVLNGGSADNWSNGGNASHWAIASFMGSLNYDYSGKYLFSFKIRTDGSSRFASGHKWSSFPSVSGAWRISDEKFMRRFSSFLDDLKIRASWGMTGASSGLGLYPSYTTIGIGNTVLNNTYVQTAYLKSLGNEDLGWEKTSMFDIGADIQILGNRLGAGIDYYIKNTKDILIGLPVPMEYGFGKPNVNIGEIENRGWEIELKWNDKIGNVSYGIAANLSNNKNKVLDLAGTGPWKSGYTEEGLPMNSFYGYEAIGYFQSEEEIKNAPFQNVKNKPGDIKYKDQNNDKKINGDDRVVLGDRTPHYLYGLRLNASWKGFDISMFFQGIGKKDYMMSGPGVYPLSDAGKGPIFVHQLDYWTEDNRNAKYPRLLDSNEGSFNHQTSDFWKINAGYLRMKNLQLGYNFSNSLIKNTGFSNLRLFFTASNLFTIDNFVPGYDPETSSAYTYPLARTYSFGLNVQF